MSTSYVADGEVFARARCIGSTDHDARGDGEPLAHLIARHDAAADQCRRCPCATACAALHQSLPRPERAFGVWAGRSEDLAGLRSGEDVA